MTFLLEFRDWIKQVYARFSLYIMAGIRFLTTLVVVLLINQNIGYMTRLKNPVIALILAMVSAFLPANVIVIFAAALILLNLYVVSIEMAAIMLTIFLILLLIYYRFSPKYCFVLLLTPVAFAFRMPFLIPLIIGIVATPVSMIPAGFGTVIYYLLHQISQSSLTLLRTDDESTTQAYLYVLENTFKNPELYLMLVTLAVTALAVYIIRRLSVDHSWTIAIVTGALLDIIALLTGDFLLDISTNLVSLIVGVALALLITFVLQFFLFSVDYTRTEYVQFEDDEYYYYVKAIPKMTIAKREKHVKRINPQKNKDGRKNAVSHKMNEK